MGQWYTFICSSCQYETKCADGPDRGIYLTVVPMICIDCKEINNVAIGEFDRRGHHKLYEKLECPSCEGANLLSWNLSECPKCDGKMNRSNKKAILWD